MHTYFYLNLFIYDMKIVNRRVVLKYSGASLVAVKNLTKITLKETYNELCNIYS